MESLITQLHEKKESLRAMAAEVSDLEIQIAKELSKKDEGSTTKKFGRLKVTVTNKMNRTVDQEQVQQLREVIPADEFDALFPSKHSLSLSTYRDLSDNQRRVVATAVTAKPAKPSVKIEVMKDGI